jgi:hypothetical protein
MTTEQLNEARNRPWADAQAVASDAEAVAPDTQASPPTIGLHQQPGAPSGSTNSREPSKSGQRRSKSGQRRWPRWPAVLLLAGVAIAVLVLVWGRQSGQLEVTVERKRAVC